MSSSWKLPAGGTPGWNRDSDSLTRLEGRSSSQPPLKRSSDAQARARRVLLAANSKRASELATSRERRFSSSLRGRIQKGPSLDHLTTARTPGRAGEPCFYQEETSSRTPSKRGFTRLSWIVVALAELSSSQILGLSLPAGRPGSPEPAGSSRMK